MRDVPKTLGSPLRTTPPSPPPAPPATAESGTPGDQPSSWSPQVRVYLMIGRRALEQIRTELRTREAEGAEEACEEALTVEKQVVSTCVAGALAQLLNAPAESTRPDPRRSEPLPDEAFVARFRGHLLCLFEIGVAPETLDQAFGTNVFQRCGDAERAPLQTVAPRYCLPTALGLTLEDGLTLPGLVFGAAALRALQHDAEQEESYADLETLERGLYRRYLATMWAACLAGG